MTSILAIDPGNTESGWCIIDATTHQPLRFGKTNNHELHQMLDAGDMSDCRHAAIEMVASYGMPVGREVFETCIWIGRYLELLTNRHAGPVDLVYRLDVKLHHCHTSKAKDSNIGQALVDRFAPGQPNHGKGTKAAPGWFYGFKSDIWQAYALAVHIADTTSSTAVAS